MAAKRLKTKITPDDQLTEYLKVAEEALIGAVKLFSEHKTLNRRVGYLTRLVRAQEGVTGLHREELVRALATKGRKGRKKA
jgi:hypothetical protein